MLKRIQRVKGLGVFGDYAAGAETSEFGVKNLIYGWNYSGKTTLSRLVSTLERKAPPPDLPPFSFVIDTDNGSITEANYPTSPLVVRVFNADFIAENLNFAGSSFKPILLLGADSEKAQKQIDELEKELGAARTASEHATKTVAANKKTLDSAKTTSASAIKTAMGIVEAFGATQLEKQIGLVKIDPAQFRLSAPEIEEKLKLARAKAEDQLPPLPSVAFPLILDSILTEVEPLLSKIPDMAHTIEHLAQNPSVESWISTGLSLHAHKAECEFCGGGVKEDRLATLSAHFSKDLANHKQNLANLKSKLAGAELSYTTPKDAEVEPAYRARLTQAIEPLQTAIAAYNKAIDIALQDLDRKSEAPFKTVTPSPVPAGLAKAVADAAKAVNVLIDSNNGAFKNFPSDKTDAINTLKLHYAQKFCADNRTDAHAHRQTRLGNCAKAYDARAAKLAERIQELKAVISKSQLGREEINKRIHSLLGNNSVHIEVVKVGDEERFQLRRSNGKPAKHLSEGEKTAIAFSYFLTRLGEIKKLSEAIIYIDDPISSLDSNHIFQVTAIIKEAFFYQEKLGAPWTTRCKQIFLSTHNFEFFSLMRELKPDKTTARGYLVKRVSPSSSILTDLPKSLSDYPSEYHFLFGILNEFQQAPDKRDFRVLMMLPNAARRFLELYTYAKYPDTRGGTVDQRADRIFGEVKSKRILKVLHHFSHANNIERLAENNELMCDIEAAVKELMTALEEEDPMHMEALRAAVA
ncbi:AAA family ATPase [Massilia sp. YIM B04103]|uniref:AAA family ATPase n=1 Tax=Massilia sp. YIM B04103 TaxID=2963106 RepID=UPI00210D78F5|nr:AAA family ATPase [Massilia sp. YIM B04103]